MKHTQLFLVLAFLLIKATALGQCTTPPVLNSISNEIEKCGDYYNYSVYPSHNIAERDSTSYTLDIFDFSDTDHTIALYTETTKNPYGFYLDNVEIPGNHDAFIVQITATNDCGTDSLDIRVFFKGSKVRNVFPDTLGCEGFTPSYISGPTELTSCDHDAVYVLHTPMYDSLDLPFFYSWRITYEGAIMSLGNNFDSLFLQEFPPNDFTLTVITWDSCGCNGFKNNFTTVASLDIRVLPDSSCGSISGQVFGDRTNSCFNEEFTIPRRPVKLTDDYYTYTDNNGSYDARLSFGNYDVTLANSTGETDCNTNPFNITLDANNPTAIQDLHAIIDEEHMHIALQASRARVGRTNAGRVYLENRYFDQTNRELTLTWPNEVTMGNISPTPASITGNVIRWSNINMDAFERKYFYFQYTLNQGVDIGDEIPWYATLEGQPSYSDSAFSLVVNSYDPNEVIVNKSEVLDTEVNKRLKYTVHFQNTGNDTAYLVRVIDTLDAKLDMATLTVLGASHDFEFDIVSGNVMQWTFDNINLLDSTSNEEKSKGYFQFFVNFKDDVIVNDFAESTAHIYFDTNEPIVTNTTVSTITNKVGVKEFSQVTFSLHPNPAITVLQIRSQSTITTHQIIGIDGRIIKTGGSLSKSDEINIQTLSNGIYYLKVIDAQGNMAVQPFEKM